MGITLRTVILYVPSVESAIKFYEVCRPCQRPDLCGAPGSFSADRP